MTLVLIVIGFIVLSVRAVRTDSPTLVLLAAAAPPTLLYIARPSISPDHLWAMRRYMPIVLPVMTIAAGRGRGMGCRRARRAAAVTASAGGRRARSC